DRRDAAQVVGVADHLHGGGGFEVSRVQDGELVDRRDADHEEGDGSGAVEGLSDGASEAVSAEAHRAHPTGFSSRSKLLMRKPQYTTARPPAILARGRTPPWFPW